jgi:hypothetical protein
MSSTTTTTTGPTGISPGVKYIVLAILTVAIALAGYLEGQTTYTLAVGIAAAVYVLPTIVSEFEGASGLSAAVKYTVLAVLAVLGVVLGQLEHDPVISTATVVSALVYALPTIVQEFEGA